MSSLFTTREASTTFARCAAPGRRFAPYVDSERYAETTAFLGIQEKEALLWRDACIAYFQSISKRPLPAGYAPPEHTLAEYEAISTPYAPGNPGWTAAPFRH